MRNIFKTIIIVFSFLIKPEAELQAFTSEHPSGISSADIPGIIITREDKYDGTSLWGYIDGGADVYLEYGFDKLLSQEAKSDSETFRIDIYRMTSPEAAYGIYSVSKFKCLSDTLSKYCCITQYQVQIAHGSLYISVASESGSAKAQQTAAMIACRIMEKNESAEDFNAPALFYLPELTSDRSDLMFFNGKLGVQNGLPDWLDIFENSGRFSMYYLPLQVKDGNTDISLLIFESNEDRAAFIQANGFSDSSAGESEMQTDTGIYKFIRLVPQNGIIILTSDRKAEELKDIINIIKNYK